jgi:hypothetical protein
VGVGCLSVFEVEDQGAVFQLPGTTVHLVQTEECGWDIITQSSDLTLFLLLSLSLVVFSRVLLVVSSMYLALPPSCLVLQQVVHSLL